MARKTKQGRTKSLLADAKCLLASGVIDKHSYDRITKPLLGKPFTEPVYKLTPEEAASLDKSLRQAARREFASDEEVRALWAKYGL
jgi:hypothetical protein